MFANMEIPAGVMQFILQGGAFSLLAVCILLGIPWVVRQWKEMTADMTSAMRSISAAMEGLSRRLDRIEDHLEIDDRFQNR